MCFSENDGPVLLHLAPTPDGAGLTKGRKQDTCGSESWQIHRAVVCPPEPPVPDAGLRDSHKLSVWKRSVSPKTDRPPCNCSPHIIRQTINVASIGRRLDAKLREQMKICVNSMLCLMARPQIHLPNVKTCLDVVNTYSRAAAGPQGPCAASRTGIGTSGVSVKHVVLPRVIPSVCQHAADVHGACGPPYQRGKAKAYCTVTVLTTESVSPSESVHM